ncbi:MAG: phospholipase D-like domain-containing protein [Candidatus Omnitrophota bacterium]
MRVRPDRGSIRRIGPYGKLGIAITIWSFLITSTCTAFDLPLMKRALSPPSNIDPIAKIEDADKTPVVVESRFDKDIKNGFKEDYYCLYVNNTISKALESNAGTGELSRLIGRLETIHEASGLGGEFKAAGKRGGFYIEYLKSTGGDPLILHYFLNKAEARTCAYTALPFDTERTLYCETISGKEYEKIKDTPPVAFSTDGGCERQVIEAMGEAERTIDIAIYEFDNRAILAALLKAHERGVKVRVVMDKCNVKRKAAGELKGAGIETVIDKRKSGLMHNKFMIVDDKFVVTGSYNWTEKANDYRENTIVLGCAEPFREEFERIFGGVLSGRSPPGARGPPSRIKALFSPHGGCHDEIKRIIEDTKAAKSAHPEYPQTIDIALYYFTDRDIAGTLFEAKEAGVDVRIILDKTQKRLSYGIEEFLRGLEREAERKRADGQVRGSLIIRYHRIPHGIMHNKFALIGQNTLTGSYNWTAAAEKKNSENLVVIPGRVRDYEEEFERIWKDYESPAIIDEGGPGRELARGPPAGPGMCEELSEIDARPFVKDALDKIEAANLAVFGRKSAYPHVAPSRAPPLLEGTSIYAGTLPEGSYSKVIKDFEDGKYDICTVVADSIRLFRVFDSTGEKGKSRFDGPWFSEERFIGSPPETKANLFLGDYNDARMRGEVMLKRGTVFLFGNVANGRGTQIYVPWDFINNGYVEYLKDTIERWDDLHNTWCR